MFVTSVILLLAARWSRCSGLVDICQVCDCVPSGDSPVQAFCVDKEDGEVFWPATSPHSKSLQLVYVSGIRTVKFDQNSFETEKPLDLILQNCSTVHISDYSMNRLRSLVMQDIKVARVGALCYSELWSVMLENIEHLSLFDACFGANYSVKIGNIGSLTILATQDERTCENSELRFTLSGSVLNHIHQGELTVCGNQVKLESNTFKSVAEGGLQITAETSIQIANNHFENLDKKVFNLSSPEIHISSNNFNTLPAGALSGVSTIQDTFFTNNTIQDIDLGGVLLDMGWGMTIEKNTINCDCASKRTSILNPKQDMLYLTNTSHETLQNIFLNNYCSLNCTVTLKEFSYALIQGDVCLTNDTKLEEEQLCDITTPENPSEDESTRPNDFDPSLVSAASRVEFLVPLSIIAITILITSSLCYGYKEMKTFKFVFNPQRSVPSKLPTD